MLKKCGVGLAFIGALMFGVFTVDTVLAGSVTASHEEGKKADLAQVPAAVKAAIEKETAGGTIKETVKKEVDGKTCYAVEYVKDGMKKTLHIMYKVIDGGIYVEYIKDGMEKTVGFTEEGKRK